MIKNTLEELYGVTLGEYCIYHNTDVDTLVEKTKKDIELLSARLKKLLYEEDNILDPLVDEIAELRDKKIKHLSRLENWIRQSRGAKDE